MNDLTRRSVAKGSLWSIPALSVVVAAPSVAASCIPTSVSQDATVEWVSTQTAFSSPTGDPEDHTVLYTFSNTGSTVLPVGVKFVITVTMTVADGETDSALSIDSASSNVSASASLTSSVNPDQSVTWVNRVEVVTSEEIPASGTFSVAILTTYGYLPAGGIDSEDVTANSPQVTYVESTCATTTTTFSISGSSDGTSYTS